MRPFLFAIAFTLIVAVASAPAQETRLPDIGSSAGTLLTPARQAEYGAMMLRELRNYNYVLDDPLLDDWLQAMGNRLGSNSDLPQQSFTFFVLKDRQINAFATLGGYIAVNAGLILTAEREDEVAAVVSHEIAHVTQQHVLRAVERAQRDQVPILLGILAAIIAAQQMGGGGDSVVAGLVSWQGLALQAQINYTRSNESEADRLGIRTLVYSGYDADAMAGFFRRMSLTMRSNQGGYSAPDYLRTHPVTNTRISEANHRAEQLKQNASITKPSEETPTLSAIDNPLLPSSVQIPASLAPKRSNTQFEWAKERMRVLTASTADAAVREYEALRRNSGEPLNDAQQYGLAIAQLRAGGATTVAAETLAKLSQTYPDNLWVALALAEVNFKRSNSDIAAAQFEALLHQLPNSRPVALTYAKALNEQATQASGQRAQALLRPLLASSADNPVFQQTYARASELAGDNVRASEAYAEVALLNGRAEQALAQLEKLKNQDDLDYISLARINARITAITPQALELRRQRLGEKL